MKARNIIIVGGGYLGAMTALLFSQNKNANVILVEKQDRLGGLYNCAWTKQDRFFDYGSRAILQTGIKELDDLVFSILPENEYPKTTDNLKEFSFQSGQACGYSNCLDARLLPEDIFQAGKKQLLSIKESELEGKEFSNLEELCLATYGEILTRNLIEPAIVKLTGVAINQLDTSALAIHGLHRIIIADQEESRKLKAENDFNGNRIAFAKYNDNPSSMIKTYPRTKGLSDYGERIKKYLNASPRVELILEDSVVDLEAINDRIESVTLESGRTLECESIIWTVPSIFLARLMKTDVSGLKPPSFRNTVLAHYILDGTLNTDAYFTYNYDPKFLSYRSTFYDNFSETPDSHKSVTVEVFHDGLEPDLEAMNAQIFKELKQQGLIASDSSIVDSHLHFHRGSWPTFQHDFFANQAHANATIRGDLENIHFLGKANGKHHSAALVHSAHDLYQEMFALS